MYVHIRKYIQNNVVLLTNPKQRPVIVIAETCIKHRFFKKYNNAYTYVYYFIFALMLVGYSHFPEHVPPFKTSTYVYYCNRK